MKNRVAHVVTFLIVLLGTYIFSISPSLFHPKARITALVVADNRATVHARVCPPHFLYDPHPADGTLRGLVRNTIHDAILEEERLSGRHWRVGPFNLDSELLPDDKYLPDGRCRDVTAELRALAADDGDLFQEKTVLRVGVRDGQSFISRLDPATGEWRGAAIDFAHMLATAMGRQARFTRIRHLNARFTAIQYGVVDLTISLISHTPEREELAFLSLPYFETGLVLGDFSGRGKRIIRTQQLNNAYVTIVAAAGSVGEKSIRKNFPRAGLVLVESADMIPDRVRALAVASPKVAHYFVTDEAIAHRWPGARVLLVDGEKLLTRDDNYVVAMGRADLVPVVNRVIRQQRIAQLYSQRAAAWQALHQTNE